MYNNKYAYTGMTFHRMSLFIWAVLNSSLVMLSLLFWQGNNNVVDRSISIQHFLIQVEEVILFVSTLFWFSGHPEAYIQFYRFWYVSVVITTIYKNKFSDIWYGICYVSIGILGFMYGHIICILWNGCRYRAYSTAAP